MSTYKKINNVWHRLSFDGYCWRETGFSDLDIKIKEIEGLAFISA